MNRDGMSDTFAKYEKLLHGVREVLDKEQHEKWAAQEKLKEALAEIECKDRLIEKIKEEVDRSCKSCASSACGCRDYCTEGVILDLIEGKDNAALLAADWSE